MERMSMLAASQQISIFDIHHGERRNLGNPEQAMLKQIPHKYTSPAKLSKERFLAENQ